MGLGPHDLATSPVEPSSSHPPISQVPKMREFNRMLTLYPANTCPPVDHVVPPYALPHVHTNLGTSQLANSNANTSGLLAARSRGLLPPVFHFAALLWPPVLQRSKSRDLANSRSSRPIPWVFSYKTPMHDPTCGSNDYPRFRSNSYSPSRFSCPCDLGFQMFGPLPCELPSSRDPSISDTCPLQRTVLIFSPLRYS
jgi:hypothetical protein